MDGPPQVMPWQVGPIFVPCVIDGSINDLTFQTYIEQTLVLTLTPSDLVIIDNRGSHKAVRRAIEAAGASLLYLPPHSPDLNPSNRPSHAQGQAARSRRSIRPVERRRRFPRFTAQECLNYFAN